MADMIEVIDEAGKVVTARGVFIEDAWAFLRRVQDTLSADKHLPACDWPPYGFVHGYKVELAEAGGVLVTYAGKDLDDLLHGPTQTDKTAAILDGYRFSLEDRRLYVEMAATHQGTPCLWVRL